MLGYWINDLPLPSPANQYRWAKDPALLVSFFLAFYEHEMRQSIPQRNRKRKYSLKKQKQGYLFHTWQDKTFEGGYSFKSRIAIFGWWVPLNYADIPLSNS